MGSVTISLVTVWLSLILLFISSCYGDEVADGGGGREALEIIIGGGGISFGPSPAPDCPPPPPPPVPVCPPPLPPPPPPPPPPVVPVCPTPSHPPPSPPHSPPPPPPSPPHSPPPPPPSPPHSPPPPPPRAPTPSLPRFPNKLIEASYKAIQKFKTKIVDDPQGYTKTWNENEGDVCNKYKGFACDLRPDNNMTAVASIDFNGAHFAGKDKSTIDISEFLKGMGDVAIIHVNSNNFSGNMPELSQLPYLYEFDISNNKYSGKFPLEVLRATNISFLDLRFNSFTGGVPPAIFKTAYDVLFVNNNRFKSTLPNLKSNTTLYLTFANNEFTGNIPKSIGEASKLLEVLFLNNSLSGCLPYEIGNLKKATVFDVGFNDLTGPIPHSFSCLKKMELLSLAANKFYGIVPEQVCELPNLVNLTLSHNYFTQVGTKCRELIKKKVLDMRMNCISGLDQQRSEKECALFFSNLPLCPDPRSFFYVPCENLYHSEGSSDGDELAGSRVAPVRSPRAYEALAPSW